MVSSTTRNQRSTSSAPVNGPGVATTFMVGQQKDSAGKAKRPYLHEVDLMRIIFIFGVLLNHTTSVFSQSMAAGSAGQLFLHATHLSLHFTRMGFMFMTGVVLFLNYYQRKNTNWLTFWRKRYSSVGIPYLAWNAILLAITLAGTTAGLTGADFWSGFKSAVLHGNRFYLYYVFVIFQLYLVFPLLVKLFQRLAGHHEQILLVSFLLQLTLVTLIKYWLPGVDRSGWPYLFRAYGMNLLTYQFYFVAGAYTAIHYQAVVALLRRHARRIYWAAGVGALATVGLYFFNRRVLGLSYAKAVEIHQPLMMLYAVIMVAFVFLIGLNYAEKRSQLSETMTTGIHLSARVAFGIYLVQTIPLMMLRGVLAYLAYTPSWLLLLLLPLGYLFVLGGSFGLAYFCYRVTPFGYLIGRPQKLKFLAKFRRKKGVPAHD
ncbi:acyltransferase [Lapidilactobacillus salsurivasis]